MNLTRWKLLAGVFGIAVCGIAALAEPACRTVGPQANRSEPTTPDAKPKGSTEPKPVPVVEVAPPELPKPPMPEPVPAVIPFIDASPNPKPTVGVTTPAELPVVNPALPVPSEKPVVGFKTDDGKIVVAPKVDPILAPAYSGPLVSPQEFVNQFATPPSPVLLPLPTTPAPAPGHNDPVPLPPKVQSQAPPVPAPLIPSPMVPAQDAPLKSNPFPAIPEPHYLTPVAPPVQEVLPVTPVNASAPSDKKLKVILQMDENNPKFEVRDGEEVVLKVVSEKVDVASPTQKGERWSTLKASGQVKFMTPGGDGFCDTLQVVPGTGDVIAVGNVKFNYHWGKVQTSATSEKMHFRLGTQPTVAK